MSDSNQPALDFINRWKISGGGEIANSQSFLKELCQLLDVPHPDPTVPDDSKNLYTFEKAVKFNNNDGTFSDGRVDLYKYECFVLESKQGAERKKFEADEALATVTKQKKQRKGTAQRGTTDWDKAMRNAFSQSKRYAEALPEWPPFLIVLDVGFCFDLYADFSKSGKNYTAFPDPANYRIKLEDLARPEVRAQLREIWLNPYELDPTKRSAKVTRELAEKLAKLARKLEQQKYEPEQVAKFLMRCLFTMFAEDIGLLPDHAFTNMLEGRRKKLDTFAGMLENLWQTMDQGGFSPILEKKIMQFNGSLFKDCTAIPLDEDGLELLIEASQAEWKDVEPSIFGTLLERALDPHERHKLGAHYTPRAYVERLVMPTIIEPLREEWESIYATAYKLDENNKRNDAIKLIREFHQKLCNTRVLDPACGSGNFLYVSMELMKRLEGEVLEALKGFGEKFIRLTTTVDPHQFLGIEINPRAAAITDLVLWIGYLQWLFRTWGKTAEIPEPIIRKFDNIECRDAILAWDAIEPVVDEQGNPVTRWDGRTTKPHPVTGLEVPDETARVQEVKYINPRKAEWPDAEFIVGNPPFIGNKRMREALGDSYTKSLREVYEPEVPSSIDYVMYWWNKAAIIFLETDNRFGFITTNSITQTLNSVIIDKFISIDKNPLSIIFAIPDHPWVDNADGAAVRIAMTSCGYFETKREGILYNATLLKMDQTLSDEDSQYGIINCNLTIGKNAIKSPYLKSNSLLSAQGVIVLGDGFILNDGDEVELIQKDVNSHRFIKKYLNGKDLMHKSRNLKIIDLYGLSLDDLKMHPVIFQRIWDKVRPKRLTMKDKARRERWWLFGRQNTEMRQSLSGLNRYIATCRTAKHRVFMFLGGEVLPDAKIIAIALDDAYYLGILQSNIHCLFALKTGAFLEDRPNYNHADCFNKFPFPAPDQPLKAKIRDLGEQLDTHRKRQQELYPELTMTGMYNVLEKLRSGEALTGKEKKIHEQGLVSVLKQIHDDLDAAVFEAYGWPQDLTDEEILERLVALNHERAEEEKNGLIRWLRPEFQNPQGLPAPDQQKELELTPDDSDEDEEESPKPKKGKSKASKSPSTATEKQPWPKSLPERIRAVHSALKTLNKPITPKLLNKSFSGTKADDLEELLDTLVAVGQARLTDKGEYVI